MKYLICASYAFLLASSGTVFAKKSSVRWGKYEGEMSWHKAHKLCKSKGMRLPTREEIWAMYNYAYTGDGGVCLPPLNSRHAGLSELVWWTSETRPSCPIMGTVEKECAFATGCHKPSDALGGRDSGLVPKRFRSYSGKIESTRNSVRCVKN